MVLTMGVGLQCEPLSSRESAAHQSTRPDCSSRPGLSGPYWDQEEAGRIWWYKSEIIAKMV